MCPCNVPAANKILESLSLQTVDLKYSKLVILSWDGSTNSSGELNVKLLEARAFWLGKENIKSEDFPVKIVTKLQNTFIESTQ